MFERKSKFISFCQAVEKKKRIGKSRIFVQSLDYFFVCCFCSIGEKGHSKQAINAMIFNLKLKVAEIPIQFLVRLHFFPLLSKLDTDAILYKVKGINKLSRFRILFTPSNVWL